jgi:hypothetical protein
MKRIASCLLILLLTNAPAWAGAENRALELQREREKLEKERDPVDRAKIGIKISDLLLDNVADSVRVGNFTDMEQELSAYVATIESAHQTLVDSGLNAQKKSGGFKDLEIALRKQVLKFDDYARMLTGDRREPLEEAKKLATGIRNKLLKALFP